MNFNQTILIGGHRGSGETDSSWAILQQKNHPSKPPENTLASIENILDWGASFIEIDVVKTKDNRLVVIHSARLNDHVFEKKMLGYISHYTVEELKKFRVCPQKNGIIPTLKEVLNLIKSYREKKNKDIFLNIEIKDVKGTKQTKAHSPEITLMDILASDTKGYESMILLSSFSLQDITIASKTMSDIPRAILFDTNLKKERPLYHSSSQDPSFYRHFNKKNILEALKTASITHVHPEIESITQEYFEFVQSLDLTVNTWSLNEKRPKDHQENIQKYKKIVQNSNSSKTSGIITNYAEETAEVLML